MKSPTALSRNTPQASAGASKVRRLRRSNAFSFQQRELSLPAFVVPPFFYDVDLAFVQLHPQRSKRRVGLRRQLPLSLSLCKLAFSNKHQQNT